MRPYVPGDDVRLIDWNVTARTGEPHVRVHLAERVLVTWIALDLSPSMAFGTADRRKADVAVGATVALAHAATVRGNRAGLVGFGNGEVAVHPPRQGRAGLLAVLSALGHDPRRGPARPPLALMLRRLSGIARRDSLVAVVSDFRGPLDWHRPLLELAGSHDLLAVEIRDPREQQLSPVGELWLIDSESGRKLRVDTNDERLRRAVRRCRGGRARGGRADARFVRRRARSPLHRGRLAAQPRRVPPQTGAEAMSLTWPLALTALALVPIAVWAYLALDQRRRNEASRFGNPALLPGLVAAEPGRRRLVPPLLVLGADPARRRPRAPARHALAAEGGGDRRARDGHLPLDGGQDVKPTRWAPPSRRPRPSSTRCPTATGWRSSPSRRRRGGRRRPTATPRGTPWHRPPRRRDGNGDAVARAPSLVAPQPAAGSPRRPPNPHNRAPPLLPRQPRSSSSPTAPRPPAACVRSTPPSAPPS